MTVKEMMKKMPHVTEKSIRYGIEALINGDDSNNPAVVDSIRKKAGKEDADYTILEETYILESLLDLVKARVLDRNRLRSRAAARRKKARGVAA